MGSDMVNKLVIIQLVGVKAVRSKRIHESFDNLSKGIIFMFIFTVSIVKGPKCKTCL